MTAELFRQIITRGGAVDLSSRAKFRLTGADRVRYLNGQLTNDVRRVNSGSTLYACVTDAKGRVAADVFMHAVEDALVLDAEADLREALAARLERYIVADDVELTDVTDQWQLWHVFGDSGRFPGLLSERCGVKGVDLWLPVGAAPPALDSLPVLSAAEWETWRVLQQIPRWPHEINAQTFPAEAGLETRAMDFSKGCYIGQEVLSRIKTTGKMPREMIAFEADGIIAVGEELWCEKPVGTVTSVVIHPESGRSIGLAMLKQGSSALALHTASGIALCLLCQRSSL